MHFSHHQELELSSHLVFLRDKDIEMLHQKLDTASHLKQQVCTAAAIVRIPPMVVLCPLPRKWPAAMSCVVNQVDGVAGDPAEHRAAPHGRASPEVPAAAVIDHHWAQFLAGAEDLSSGVPRRGNR